MTQIIQTNPRNQELKKCLVMSVNTESVSSATRKVGQYSVVTSAIMAATGLRKLRSASMYFLVRTVMDAMG